MTDAVAGNEMVPLILTFGAVFNGATVSYVLYGITCGQVARYYFTCGDDGPMQKCLVALVWTIDTLQQCLISHVIWYYGVSRCNGEPKGYLSPIWSIIYQVIPGETIIFIVQCFFIMKIWRFSKRKTVFYLLVPAVISIGFSTAFTAVVANGAKSFIASNHTIEQMNRCLLAIGAGSTILTDGAITAIMCHLLYKSRQRALSASKSLINVFINYAMTTGLLTSLVACVYLLLYIAFGHAGNMIYIAVYFVHAKVYVNSMLASLNSRESLRARLGVVQQL